MSPDNEECFEVSRSEWGIRLELTCVSHGWGFSTKGESMEMAETHFNDAEAIRLIHDLVGVLNVTDNNPVATTAAEIKARLEGVKWL